MTFTISLPPPETLPLVTRAFLLTFPWLFNFFVNSHFLEVRIVLLHFDTVGGIPTVLGRNVAADTRYIRVLLLSAFQDYLDP